MRYDNEELQDLLAGEYVLGNLRGAARRRLVTLMHRLPGLRDRVEQWEERMYPLVGRAPKVKAPDRLWHKIHARISPHAETKRTRRVWWAGFASAGALGAVAALLVFSLAPSREPPSTTVAVLHDARAQPAILASWTSRQAAERTIALRILAHPDMPPDTSWEAWLIPDDGTPPVSLGLVTTEIEQVLSIPQAAARALPRGGALGVSVEPKGGSKDGRPSGAFVFQGPALRIGG